MSKSGKKKAKKNFEIESDIRLSDFANSSAHCGRIRKSIGNNFMKNAKELANCEEHETMWYDKELEEFEFLNIKGVKKKKLQVKNIPQESQNVPGIHFPIDVWFLIGHYIKPEDVKLFAIICKDSYKVSRSYSFWLNFYKKYYKPCDNLPTRLQPECIEQAFCLKSSVIRSLFIMYPTFISQLTLRSSSADMDELSNLCCTSMWRLQVNEKWVFNFKFQNLSHSSDTSITYQVAIKDLWTDHEVDCKKQDAYVNHNPDEGCKILRFTISHFMVVPQTVIGSRLSGVRIHLAHDMRRHRLQLMFCCSNYRQTNNGLNGCKDSGSYSEVVEFDSVENVMLLNWWHPQYPLGYNI